MLYYAFDDTVNSSRYPNYAYMQSYWTSVGLDTKLDTTVTVADLRRMNNYDLCVLSTHGPIILTSTAGCGSARPPRLCCC